MGLLTRLIERRAHPSQDIEWLIKSLGGDTASGVDVTPHTSMQSTVVFACVRILAETVATLPLHVYRRLARGKERASDHPLSNILGKLANPEMTAFQFRETLIGHAAAWGNGFAEIELNRGGRVRALWPLRPDMMIIRRINRQLWYDVLMPHGPNIRLPWERVMHVAGLGYDGVIGYSPITLARQSIGLTMATEEFGATFFGNGARPGTILTHPGQLSKPAQDRLTKAIETRHQGLSNAHRLMILEEGMGIEEVGIPPDNAQFLETRKFQVNEIARLFRVPPHMVGDLDRATFSNIEEQGIEFVVYTLGPWLRRLEQTIDRDLLTESERRDLFVEHLVDALLRGNIKDRYDAYSVGRQNGWLSANDIREKENMNPVEGGDTYLVPLNMQPAGEQPEPTGEPDPPAGEPDDEMASVRQSEQRQLELEIETRAQDTARDRSQLAATYQAIIFDSASRIIRREVNDVRRAIGKFFGKRDEQSFSLWLNEFYEDHREFWQRQLQPVLIAYANLVAQAVGRELDLDESSSAEEIGQFIGEYLVSLAARQVGESINQLKALLDEALTAGEAPEDRLNERLDAWEETRPERLARDESSQAGNAFARQFYLLAGVVRLRWVNRGSENCPYCRALDGQVVGIQQVFLNKDEDFQPEGAETPLNKRHNVGHPPLHKGCDCQIVAERSI